MHLQYIPPRSAKLAACVGAASDRESCAAEKTPQGRGVQHIQIPSELGHVAAKGDLAALSASKAVELLCTRSITAVDYATALLRTAHAWECINAWSTIDAQRVRQRAGPL